jgi:ZIP family zinc transporter
LWLDFQNFDPALQALTAACASWLITALATSPALLMNSIAEKTMDAALGSAAGIMLAAACFSLLVPALAFASASAVAMSFIAGGAIIMLIDRLLPHIHPHLSRQEGLSSGWRRSVLLISAISLHNLPEGLAVGVAFGASNLAKGASPLAAALALTLAITLQNIPEGLAVILPLRREGFSKRRAWWWGQLSGLVEPLAALAGALLVSRVQALLPYALAFAAGAMVFVVVEELVPEAQRHGHEDLATGGALAGFALMMLLDAAFK